MKNLFVAFLLVASSQAFAAVGCLPGNCCNNRPCDSVPTQPSRPNPRPQPACPTNLAPGLNQLMMTTSPPYTEVNQTPTAIPLDTEWKKSIYEFSVKNVRHPSWGIAHSERDYQVTKILAAKESIDLDLDVLFAAAFLHDLGGLGAFEKEGVDHAVRSAELIEPMLTSWGFPMEKWPQVKEVVLGHTYYTAVPSSKVAQAFRDADVLDFLGTLGVARILAITQEAGTSDLTLKPTIDILKSFSKTMAAKCSLEACREMARPRQLELEQFLDSLNKASFNQKAL